MSHSSFSTRCWLATLLFAVLLASPAHAWWDQAYTIRQQVTIDTSSEGANVTTPIGSTVVLVRLHDGNFQFANAQEGGSDLRFVAADDKTPLAFHIEKFDSLMNEGFVWVKLPELPPGAKTTFWLYYGAATPGAGGPDPAATYGPDTLLAYHFAEQGSAPVDASGHGHNATAPGIPADGSIIGLGVRFSGTERITVPPGEKLTWTAADPVSFSAWIRPASLQGRRALLTAEGLTVGLEEGVPFVEVAAEGATLRTPASAALVESTWQHLAFVANAGNLELFVNGLSVGTVAATLPPLKGPLVIGGVAEGQTGEGFSGELDELLLTRSVRTPGSLLLATVAQGASDAAARTLFLGEAAGGEAGGHSATLEHVMLFGDIARNMMFDGWVAVGVCVIMIILGWAVAIKKFSYLNSIQKGSDAFMKQWQHVSTDLTALDHDDEQSVKHMGGQLDPKTLRHMHRSPLYHLYHIGSQEIRHRVGKGKDRSQGLSARSIQAIRASLETGLVRENQRMNKGLILLTISIAGGPYVGLLGTVVGVMITFAIIAKSGEVDVNSIAPGIASALLATVAGLVVAIPALFIYSYLSSRIKDLLAGMQVFIDEFIAKMAEFYPTPADLPPVRVIAEAPHHAARAPEPPHPVRAPEPQLAHSHHHAS